MSTLHFQSVTAFLDEFLDGFDEQDRSLGAPVSMKFAEIALDVGATRIKQLILENKLREIVIGSGNVIPRAIQFESLIHYYKKKKDREKLLKSITPERVKKHILDKLIEVDFAETGQCLMYSDDVMTPLGLRNAIAKDREHIGEVLGLISIETLADDICLAMLSAVVVYKTGERKGRPNDSFFSLAETELKPLKLSTPQDREIFWQEQILKLQQYVKRLQTDPNLQ